jgi:hypothetical protein
MDELLATQLRSTECATGVAPPPVNEAVAGELVALLTNETEPEAVPLVCGVNAMFTPMLAPAAIVKGRLTPMTL